MDEAALSLNLTELVEEHYALLYRFAYRLTGSSADAEDLTQQTFLIAGQKLGQLREPRFAKGWLCSILRNAYLKGVQRGGGTAAVWIERVAEPCTGSDVEAVSDQADLQLVLGEMPEEFRSPLILFYFEEFSYKEIARHMEMPIGTVMSRLARGKAYLRQRLAAAEPAAVRS